MFYDTYNLRPHPHIFVYCLHQLYVPVELTITYMPIRGTSPYGHHCINDIFYIVDTGLGTNFCESTSEIRTSLYTG